MEQIRNVCIVGAGIMGTGITQVFARAGYTVALADISEDLLKKSMDNIRSSLGRAVEKGKISDTEVKAVLGRINTTFDLDEAAENADFVVEAVFERASVKKEILSQLDLACKSHTILVSNTSSISITELASATQRPDKVAGMHFFNPAPVMRLVEVTAGVRTSQATISAVLAVAETLGKTPIEVRESPGFVVNRLLIPMLNEACFLLAENIADLADIDTAMKLGCNHPMGPFELMDMIGLDIVLDIIENLFNETGDPKFRPSPLLKKMVRAGLLGKKSGQGFYTYEK